MEEYKKQLKEAIRVEGYRLAMKTLALNRAKEAVSDAQDNLYTVQLDHDTLTNLVAHLKHLLEVQENKEQVKS